MFDYHLHNHFSSDSKSVTDDIVKKAIESGIEEICLTNHVETFDNTIGGIGSFDFKEVCKRFEEVKNDLTRVQSIFPKIRIKFGVELEYKEEWMKDMAQFTSQTDFDFLIGSVHEVEGAIVSDSKKKNVDILYGHHPESYVYRKYFEILYKMVEWGHFNVIGHMDVFKKAGVEYYGSFQPQKYKSEIMRILELAKQKGIGLELNTSGLRHTCKELFPHPDILKWAVAVGIEFFTTGSDAHTPKDVGRDLNVAQALAKEVGIKNLSTYEKGVPKKFTI